MNTDWVTWDILVPFYLSHFLKLDVWIEKKC